MDALLEKVGAFGKFQIINLFLIGSLTMIAAMPTYATVFLLAQPKIICKYIFNYDDDDVAPFDNVCEIMRNITESNGRNITQTYRCEFDKTYYGSSLVTDWNLFCERKYMTGLTQTIYMIGTVMGLLSGYFSDTFGRKRTAVAFSSLLSLTLLIFQLLQLNILKFDIDTKYVIYCIGQFFIGVFAYCLYLSAFVLCFEITSHRYHTRIAILQLYFYVVGEIVVMIISYVTRDWSSTIWVMTAISISISVISYFFLTESPKWIIAKRRINDANKLFSHIAKINNKKYAKEELMSIMEQDENVTRTETFTITESDKIARSDVHVTEKKNLSLKIMLMALLCPRKQLIKTLFLMYVWVAVSLVYYGVGLGITTVDESINPYVIYSFQSIFEIFGYTLSLINDKFGRRKTNIFYFFVAGVMCIVISFVPRNKDLTNANKVLLDSIMIISLTAIGKCVVSASYNTCYVFSSEFFETSVRSFALNALSCFGQVGSFLAPQVNLLSDVWKPLPYFIFSITSFVSCVFVFLLPDTKKPSSVTTTF